VVRDSGGITSEFAAIAPYGLHTALSVSTIVPEACALLLDHPAFSTRDWASPDPSFSAPLHWLVDANWFTVNPNVDRLVKSDRLGAALVARLDDDAVNALDASGGCALTYAVRDRRAATLKALIARGRALDLYPERRRSPKCRPGWSVNAAAAMRTPTPTSVGDPRPPDDHIDAIVLIAVVNQLLGDLNDCFTRDLASIIVGYAPSLLLSP
jgi:hypothetical protein